jgi:predicted methyltransferase
MQKLSSLFLGLTLVCSQMAQAVTLEQAIQSEQRGEAQKARDQYRHPQQTLEFFGIQPNMTVVEIWPGAGGWYTEILAPYLRDQGKLYEAVYNSEDSNYYNKSNQRYQGKLATMPSVYDKVQLSTFMPPDQLEIAPAGSADMVLTFRNAHNWYMQGGQDNMLAAFKGFYTALKPGGVLGVVAHRLPANRPASDQDDSGYMKKELIVAIAIKAGFKLVASSEVNANDKDNADHSKGAWTLPPSLGLGDEDKDTYVAIGESDRMTLKFMK